MNNEQWRNKFPQGNLSDYNRRDGAWPSGYSEEDVTSKMCRRFLTRKRPRIVSAGVVFFAGQQEQLLSIFRTVFTGLIVPPAQAASLQTATTNRRSPLHRCGMSASRIAAQHWSVSTNQQFG
jgi:hypothetical protein